MCRGCKSREAIIRRTAASIEAAVDALGVAFAQGVTNTHLRDGGMARFRAIVIDCAVCRTVPRAPPPPVKRKTPARRAAGASDQLALAF